MRIVIAKIPNFWLNNMDFGDGSVFMIAMKKFDWFRVIAFAVFFAVAIWNFMPMFSFTAIMFQSPIEDMRHGFVIPLFSAYLLFKMSRDLRRVSAAPSIAGAVWVLFLLVLAWFGGRGGQSRMEQVAFIGMCCAVPYAFWGKSVARLLVFPVAYLCFTIPVSSFIDFFTIHLRIFSSTTATALLNGFGLLVERSGTALFSKVPGSEFNVDVADPCSGIRSLFAMMALAAAYGYCTQKTLFRKWVVFLCSIPIAVIGNTLRIMSICLVAYWFGQDVATGYYHDYSGYIVFLAGLGLLLTVGTALDDRAWVKRLEAKLPGFLRENSATENIPTTQDADKQPTAVGWIIVTSLTVIALTVFCVNRNMPPPEFDSSSFVAETLPEQIGEFNGEIPYFCHNPQCLNVATDADLIRTGQSPGHFTCPICKGEMKTISLGEFTDLPEDTVIRKREYRSLDGMHYSVSVVIGGRRRNSIHRAELCLPAQGFSMQNAGKFQLKIGKDGAKITVRRIQAKRSGGKMINLIYWFESPDHCCCSHTVRILNDVLDRSISNRINRWVMISISFNGDLDSDEAVCRLEQFLSEFYGKVIVKRPEK